MPNADCDDSVGVPATMGDETAREACEAGTGAGRDGPSFAATSADLSMKRLCSYLDRIKSSSSLSLSFSIMRVGGGFLDSFGL